jgi:hypothetical protein
MKKPYLFIALLLCAGLSYAQEAAVSAGGGATGTGGSASYSVGQVTYTTPTGSNGSMAQGVQQPYEISATTGIEVTEVNLSFVAYPNPTKNNLTLSVGKLLSENLSFQLVNTVGKLIQEGRINTETISIKMEALPKAIYFVRVMDGQELLKTFKTIKN